MRAWEMTMRSVYTSECSRKYNVSFLLQNMQGVTSPLSNIWSLEGYLSEMAYYYVANFCWGACV
jgi:hypothetical protein